MIRRSRAREIALQILYEEDINPSAPPERTEDFIARRVRSDELRAFTKQLVDGVRRNREELDVMLSSIATNWSLGRMAAIDRNILRIGAFEIVYSETPKRVAINEAVELVKRYGAKHSPKFVNGILDKLSGRPEQE
jgi:N utilization substance protein B